MTDTTKRLAGVIGWPVAHSRSPRLHGHWLNRYGIDGAYLPLAVEPKRIEEALRGLLALGFAGANVTIPHKEAAYRLCDARTARAEGVGAVNTLVVREGALLGDNTDGFGFLENLKQEVPGLTIEDKTATVLGAGGASRAVIVALSQAGAAEIRLSNRTEARAAALAEELEAPLRVVAWEERNQALANCDLLVNTTSLGMTGQAPLDLDLSLLPAAAVVNDLVYAPLQTELLKEAAARGNVAVDGLGMLLHQARPGFAAWFGREPEVDRALRDAVLGD